MGRCHMYQPAGYGGSQPAGVTNAENLSERPASRSLAGARGGDNWYHNSAPPIPQRAVG